MKCSETGTGRRNQRGRGEEMEKCRRCQTKNRMELLGITRIPSDGFDVLADERTHFRGRNRNSSTCEERPAPPLALLNEGMSAGGPASGARPHRQPGPSGRFTALVPGRRAPVRPTAGSGDPRPSPNRVAPSCRKIDRFVG